MTKQKIFFSLIIISSLVAPLIAEEENADKIILVAKKISIKTGTTYGGFVMGLVAGCFVGNTITQEEDTSAWAAKVGTLTIAGAICGTIVGKNIGRKYIEYYYPEKPEPASIKNPHQTTFDIRECYR
jgi:uncharacterized protein YcfJ